MISLKLISLVKTKPAMLQIKTYLFSFKNRRTTQWASILELYVIYKKNIMA